MRSFFDRYVGAFCALILVMCAAGIAQAQTRDTACSPTTPTNALCVDGTPPTTYTDGTPITKTLTYRVEQRIGTSGAWVQVATGLAAPRYYAQNLADGTYFFRIYANCTPNCAESAASNVASRAATQPITTPGAPVIIVAATIRAGQPPTYRIVYTVRPREGEVVFLAPESMRKVFAAR